MGLLKKIILKVFFGNRFTRKGIKFGKGSYVREHAQIGGGKHISLGNHTRISPYARLQCFELISSEKLNPQITIGNNVFIGRNVTISCCNKVTIGDDTMITGYVFICDSNHGMTPNTIRYERQKMIKKSVEIGKNVFIGEKALILPGVTIGDNCIIGAGSVVTKSFCSNVMIAGNPAKIIKKYNFDNNAWEKCEE